MKCPKCHEQLDIGDQFCSNCGTRIDMENINSTDAIAKSISTGEEVLKNPSHGSNTSIGDQQNSNKLDPEAAEESIFIKIRRYIRRFRLALLIIFGLIFVVTYFTGDSNYIKTVKEIRFENSAFGNKTIEEIVVAMARYVTHDQSINKKDFKWEEKKEGKNNIVTATCNGPNGKVTVRIATKESKNYVSTNTDWIQITYNGKTTTLTDL